MSPNRDALTVSVCSTLVEMAHAFVHLEFEIAGGNSIHIERARVPADNRLYQMTCGDNQQTALELQLYECITVALESASSVQASWSWCDGVNLVVETRTLQGPTWHPGAWKWGGQTNADAAKETNGRL
jgi:hypothetical protein